MPSLPLLNIIIAMIFIFLLLSLICSALKELMEGILKKRGRNLRLGIETLLGKDWADKLYNHGLIKGLYRPNTNPAYIPAKTFSTALVDLTSAGAALPAPLQQALDAIKTQVGQGTATLEAGIEDWYNAAMDRVSGWYKRHTQLWLFFLAVLVTLAMNVDAIQVAQALSANPQLAVRIADTAGKHAEQNRTSTGPSGSSITPNTTSPSATPPQSTPPSNAPPSTARLTTSTTSPTSSAVPGSSTAPKTTSPSRPHSTPASNAPPSPAPSTTSTTSPISAPTTATDTTKAAEDAQKKAHDAEKNLNGLGIPIGWDGNDPGRKAPWDPDVDYWAQVWALLRSHWAGWLVTMIAISFGAPFWFDLLNRFVVIRSTVKPSEKSPTEPSKS